MGLRATRKLLSVILAVLTAACTVLMLASFVVTSTLSSQGYITKHLINETLVAECESQLNIKYDALALKSGIPARVFEMAASEYGVEESLNTAAQYIFSEESATLYNQDRVDYFCKLCTEYLEGNDISYKKEYVQNTAEEAAQIYSDCIGIHNADTVKDNISGLNQSCAKIGSAALVVIVAALILLTVMYKTKSTAYLYSAGAAAGGGIAATIGSLVCLIAKVGSDFAVEPAIYQQSFSAMIRLYFIILLIVSIAFSAIAYSFSTVLIKKNNSRNK
ncbi:MAG: hypothetical protein ACLUFN_02510 [Eubacterium sp.]